MAQCLTNTGKTSRLAFAIFICLDVTGPINIFSWNTLSLLLWPGVKYSVLSPQKTILMFLYKSPHSFRSLQ
jgi:hypothetical protein